MINKIEIIKDKKRKIKQIKNGLKMTVIAIRVEDFNNVIIINVDLVQEGGFLGSNGNSIPLKALKAV